MEFTYSQEHVGTVKVKKYINGLEGHDTFQLTRDPGVIPNDPDIAYPHHCVPIYIKKIEDIKQFRLYLPDTQEVSEFYSDVFALPTIQQQEADEIH